MQADHYVQPDDMLAAKAHVCQEMIRQARIEQEQRERQRQQRPPRVQRLRRSQPMRKEW